MEKSSYLELLGFYPSSNIIRPMKSSNTMDGAFSTQRIQKKSMKVFVVGKLEGENHLEGLGAAGRRILKLVLKIEFEAVDWRYLNQDGDRWRPVVNWSVKLGSIKMCNLLSRLRTISFLKKDTGPLSNLVEYALDCYICRL